MLPFVLLLALVWGVLWAVVLQFAPLGRFLAQRRTWLTVVIGVGVDLGILFIVLPWQSVLPVLAVVSCSAVGIVGRSLYNEYHDHQELIRGLKDPAGK